MSSRPENPLCKSLQNALNPGRPTHTDQSTNNNKKTPYWPSESEEDDLNHLTVYQQHVITVIQNSTGNVTLFRRNDQTDRTAINRQVKQGRKLRKLAPAAA